MSRHPSKSSERRVARRIASSPAVAGFRPAGVALAVAAAFSLPVQAQNAGTIVYGTGTITHSGANTAVNIIANGGGGNHSVTDWTRLNVPGGSITSITQPSASSTSINRVFGNPTAIYGTLSSNGRVVLVNPSGITVGQGAFVDTAAFTASTLAMSNDDAFAGRLRFSGGSGALKLEGDAKVLARSGDVILIGAQVQVGRDAVVQADGAAVLAAGEKVELTGRGLEGIVMQVQAGNEAVNLGSLKGDAVGIFARTLKHSGLISAQAVSAEGGKVVLKAIGGDALVDGAIQARAGNKGGTIDVLGERVGLLAGANLQANGPQGGGSIRIGGDYQGANASVPNASRTYVDANARIEANATQDGDGGRVIVWSDEVTRMHGQIAARGGDEGGNGGFAEVSGKQHLEITEVVDLRAPKGAMGTLLLDPEDITIYHDTTISSTNTFPSADGTGNAKFEPSSAAPVRLADFHLNAQLGASNVRVTTSSSNPSINSGTGGMITLEADAVVTWTNPNDLKLEADKGISLLGTIRANDSASVVHLHAKDGGITGTGAIETFSLLAEAHKTTTDSVDGGVVRLNGSNKVGTVAGSADTSFTLQNVQQLAVGSVQSAWTSAAVDGITSAGDVALATKTGNITLTRNVTSTGTASTVSLQAAAAAVNQLSTAVIQAPKLLVVARGATLNSANMVDSLAANIVSGGFAFTNAKSFAVDALLPPGSTTPVSGITASGDVSLIATAGNIAINRGIQSGTTLYLESAGGITQDATNSVLQAPNLLVITDSGNATLGGANLVGTVAAEVSGDFTLNNAQTLTVGSVTSPFESTTTGIIADGMVDLSTTAGNIEVPGLQVESTGSSVRLTAADSILGFGDFITHGRSASAPLEGSVTLIASSGQVEYNAIRTQGLANGTAPFGGNVTVTAGTHIDGGNINAQGNNSTVGSPTGAMVSLTAGTWVSTGDVSAGSAGGGMAGKITIIANEGDVRTGALDVSTDLTSSGQPGGDIIITASENVEVGPVNANGAYRSTAGTAGRGGNVTITADGEIVLTANGEGDAITANGEDGGISPGIVGGEGGKIRLVSGRGVRMATTDIVTDSVGPSLFSGSGRLSASGGNGEGGAAGGNGGKIYIERTDGNALVLDPSIQLFARGGQGGNSPVSAGGTGGNGGTVKLVSKGTVELWSPTIVTAPGAGGNSEGGPGPTGALGNFSAKGTAVEVLGDFTLDAIWTNKSPVNLRDTSVVRGTGRFDNLGTVNLYDTSQLAPDGGVQNHDDAKLTSFGSDTLANLRINTGLVEVKAGSRLAANGFTTNAGVIHVDGTLDIGDFEVRPAPPPPPPPIEECSLCAATITGPAFTNEAAGLLTGNGNIIVAGGAGTLDNFGTIAPGTDGTVGTLSITGNLLMESGSTVNADLLSPSSRDVINVSGMAVTGGAYAVSYLPGVSFSAGDVFSMLRAGSLDANTLPTVNKPELTPSTRGNDFVLVAAGTPPPPPPAQVTGDGSSQQVLSEVILFSTRFELLREDTDRIGKDDIVVTDTACAPR